MPQSLCLFYEYWAFLDSTSSPHQRKPIFLQWGRIFFSWKRTQSFYEWPWWDFFLSFSSFLSKWLPDCFLLVRHFYVNMPLWIQIQCVRDQILHKCFFSSLGSHTVEFPFVTSPLPPRLRRLKLILTPLVSLTFVSNLLITLLCGTSHICFCSIPTTSILSRPCSI